MSWNFDVIYVTFIGVYIQGYGGKKNLMQKYVTHS